MSPHRYAWASPQQGALGPPLHQQALTPSSGRATRDWPRGAQGWARLGPARPRPLGSLADRPLGWHVPSTGTSRPQESGGTGGATHSAGSPQPGPESVGEKAEARPAVPVEVPGGSSLWGLEPSTLYFTSVWGAGVKGEEDPRPGQDRSPASTAHAHQGLPASQPH